MKKVIVKKQIKGYKNIKSLEEKTKVNAYVLVRKLRIFSNQKEFLLVLKYLRS